MTEPVTRRAFLVIAAAAAAATTVPAFAQADDALAFVRSLYKLKALWSDVEANRLQYLTPDFAALIDENDKYSSEPDYAVDYDPLVQAQDWDVLKNFKLTLENAAGAKATVRASFVNLDQPVTVRLDLVKTADGWRVSDIHNSDGASLREEYETLNKQAKAAAAKN
jgi:Protein of unknown function (DUF3828)